MKKSNIIVICVGLIIIIASFIFSFMFYKSLNHLIIYAKKDSYAYKYAKKNLIRTFEISDSDKDKFNLRLEDFKYDIKDNEVTITKYEGDSVELVIPSSIEGKKVTNVKGSAIPNHVETLVIPKTVNKLKKEDFTTVTIKCYKNSYCTSLKNEEELDVVYINDSETYYFNNLNHEFTYNIGKDGLTITNYIGKDELVIIPEQINGKKVVSLKFDGSNVVGMYIPSTVKSISGDITSSIVNKYFITTSIILIISFIIFVLTNIFSKVNKLVDLVYRMPQYIVSILYLGLISYIMHLMRTNPISYNKYIIYSIIAGLVYVLISVVLGKVHKTNKEFDKQIKDTGSFIREANGLIEDLKIEDFDDVKEALKYSDPVSIDDVKELEIQIIKLIRTKSDKEEIMTLINKRNRIIKECK